MEFQHSGILFFDIYIAFSVMGWNYAEDRLSMRWNMMDVFYWY